MAKNNKQNRSYLQMPLPTGRRRYKVSKRDLCGLNYRQTIDTGALSVEKNISTFEAPYLIPSEKPLKVTDKYKKPISIHGFDDFLIVVYRDSESIKLDYLIVDGDGQITVSYTGVLISSGATKEDEDPRCIVQFNVYEESDDIINGYYTKRLLIFPDKKSIGFRVEKDGFDVDDMAEGYPNIKYATVHLSRLFGVSEDSVYASGFNDYTNWSLDTVDEYNEANAWCSKTQSNTKADGNFTGITTFAGHVVCFKRDFMHEIYNTKNPFRIQDIYAEGTIDNRTIQDVDGRLIFVSDDDVKIYTGSNPRVIGYPLGMSEYLNAASGTDGRCYYLYCENAKGDKKFFVYDTYIDRWSERHTDTAVCGFANNKYGMFMLASDGILYKLDSGEYDHEWLFETDLFTNETVDIKHLEKLQVLADMGEGSNMRIDVVYYDNNSFQKTVTAYEAEGAGRKTIRVKLRSSASYGIKLRLSGKGYVKLYGIELFVASGGDLYE